jgi:hypothetical protein
MERKEYLTIHKWMRDNYGKASKCEHCNTTTSKRYDWALIANCEYAKDRDVFIELCRSCHVKYDFTEERASKISKSQTGVKNNFYGKKFTEEMKEKQRAKKVSKSIKAINTNTSEEIIFKSISECWKQLDLKKPNIIAYLKGRYHGKTYKGWKFSYC